MDTPVQSMADWFGLKAGRADYSVSGREDARHLFARSQLDEQLMRILRKAFRTLNPPKFVLFGDWGVGKTHTMMHIEHVVSQRESFPVNVVFCELPDITSKSTFQVAHAAILDSLGMDRVRTWMVQFQTKHQSSTQTKIQGVTRSEDTAKAFQSLVGYGDSARIAWDWLRGNELSPTEARSAGLPLSLNQSTALVAVLQVLGMLSKDIEGKLLLIMVDEATKLRNVTQADAIGHWVNAFKILSDKNTREAGFIISASFRDVDEMPDALSDNQVQSRFGTEHYINLPNFDPTQAKEFTSALLEEWNDSDKRAQIIKANDSERAGEPVTSKTYPFTEPALDRFVEYACRNGNFTVPRDLQKALDDVLNRAIDDGKHIVSDDYLQSALARG